MKPAQSMTVTDEASKTSIKTMVRALCNNQFKMQYKRNNASDSVTAHLKGVATRAQNRLIYFVYRVGIIQTQDWPEYR
jgi:hypothetical protein